MRISDIYVDDMIKVPRQNLLTENQIDVSVDIEVPDRIAVVNRLRNVFKTTKENGFCSTATLIVRVPLEFIQNFTIPIQEPDAWNRRRCAITWVTFLFAFFWLQGDFNDLDLGKDNEF